MALFNTIREDIIAIYVAVFGRAPEAEGVQYWENVYNQIYQQVQDERLALIRLADAMIEAASKYPGYENITDPKTLVETVYQSVLGKTSFKDDDGDGIEDNAWWVDQIKNNPNVTLGTVVYEIIKAALEQYPDHPATKTLKNRVQLGDYTAQKIQSPDINGDGKVDEKDFEVFKNLIKNVTDDPNTVEQAKQEVDKVVAGEQPEAPQPEAPQPEAPEAPQPEEPEAPQPEEPQPVQGQVFVLTERIDNIIGTEGDDIIRAVRDEAGNDTTWTAADTIDGKGGRDTIEVTIISDDGGNHYNALSGVFADNIEVIKARVVYGDTDAISDDDVNISLVNFPTVEEIYVTPVLTSNDNDDVINIQEVPSLDTKVVISGGSSKDTINVSYKAGLDTGLNDSVNIKLENAKGTLNVNGSLEQGNVELSGNSRMTLVFTGNQLSQLTITGDGSAYLDVGGFVNNANIYKVVDASALTGDLILDIAPLDAKYEFKGGSGEDIVVIDPRQRQVYTSDLKASNVEKVLININANVPGNVSLDASNLGGASVGIAMDTSDDTNRTVTFNKVADNSTIYIMGDGKVNNSDLYVDASLTINVDGASATNVLNGVKIEINNMGTALGTVGNTEYKIKDLGTVTVDYVKAITIEAKDADLETVGDIAGNKLEQITLIADEDIILNNGAGILGAGAASTLTSVDASQVKGSIKATLVSNISTQTFTYTGAQGKDYIIVGSQVTNDNNNRTLTIGTGSDKDTVELNDNVNNTGAGTTTLNIDLGADDDTLKVTATNNNGTVLDVTYIIEAGSVDFGDGVDTLYFNSEDTVDMSSVTLTNLEKIQVEGGGQLKVNADSIKNIITNNPLEVILLNGLLTLVLKNENALDLTVQNFNLSAAPGTAIGIIGTAQPDTIVASSISDIISAGAGADTITTGAGADTVILDSPFNAADKITDFTSGTDILAIDLASGAANNTKFESPNKLGSKYIAGSSVVVLGYKTTAVSKITTGKFNINTTNSKKVTGSKKDFIWTGTSIVFGANSIKIKDNGATVIKISKGLNSAAKTGVIFFYNKNDKKLYMYGVKVADGNDPGTTLDTVQRYTSKIIATITTVGGAPINDGDIYVF